MMQGLHVCKVLKQNTQPPRPSKSSRSLQRCSSSSTYPLCSDDEWKSSCPSGCTVQGLLDATERSFLQRVNKICEKTVEEENSLNRSMLLTKELYNNQRRSIVKHYVAETEHLELLEELQEKLLSLKKRSEHLAKKLEVQHILIRQQVAEMYRTEVDIDIKMRACHGSCRSAFIYHIDQKDYEFMEEELSKAGQTIGQMWRSGKIAGRIKMYPLNTNSAELPSYRNHPFIRKELLTQFEDIDQYRVLVENSAQKKEDYT
ncbi:fibrinogen alpha chain-like [Arapaima gigas]